MNKKDFTNFLKLTITVFLFSLVFTNISSSTIISESNLTLCNQELKNLTEENDALYDLYNNCSFDYHQGKNCPIIVSLLEDGNKKLSDNLHMCLENKGRFQVGFFIALGIILTIGVLFMIWKKRKE